MTRPDFSNYLAHFTSNGELKGDSDNPLKNMSAYDRLISILDSHTIRSSKMPWTGVKAVCFTECPWPSLMSHTKNYSPYGIGFTKQYIFARHGAPAIYMRSDHFSRQIKKGFDEQTMPLITPFSPSYRPPYMKKAKYDKGDCDYSHEREWRVPHDLNFKYSQVQFVILDTYEDMAKFPAKLKDAIGVDKFLLMDNYRTIERLWPIHKID